MLICVYVYMYMNKTHYNYVKRGSVYAKIIFLKSQMRK